MCTLAAAKSPDPHATGVRELTAWEKEYLADRLFVITQPGGLSNMTIMFAPACKPNDEFFVDYNVVSHGPVELEKAIAIFIMSWRKREKTDLMPPYFRPQELPPEEPPT